MSRRRFLLSACGAATTLLVAAGVQRRRGEEPRASGKPGGTVQDPEGRDDGSGGRERRARAAPSSSSTCRTTCSTTRSTRRAGTRRSSARASPRPAAAKPIRTTASRWTTSSRRSSSRATRRWRSRRRCRSGPSTAPSRSSCATRRAGSRTRSATTIACSSRVKRTRRSHRPPSGWPRWSTRRRPIPSPRGRCTPTNPGRRGGSTITTRVSRQVGEPFIRKAVELGIPRIAVHKGLVQRSLRARPSTSAPRRATIPTSRSSCTTRASTSAAFEGPYTARPRDPGGQPVHHVDAAGGDRAEPERVRGARHELVPADADARSGRARLGQAAQVRRRGQRAVGDGRHLVRLAAGPDPGVPCVPDLARAAGDLRLPGAHRRGEGEDPRPQRPRASTT